MKIKDSDFINYLHISGSIASITGIAILLIERSIENVNLSKIFAYILSSFLILAVLSLAIGFGKEIYLENIKKINDSFYRFAATIVLCIFLIFAFVLFLVTIFALVTPFLIILFEGIKESLIDL